MTEMAKVISLDDHKPGIWVGGVAKCLDCGHEWEAAANGYNVWFECPSCKLYRYLSGEKICTSQRA